MSALQFRVRGVLWQKRMTFGNISPMCTVKSLLHCLVFDMSPGRYLLELQVGLRYTESKVGPLDGRAEKERLMRE